ncbi:MAG: leucine-rich repeat domain-containing protein, partial [Ureaplasma sp.]|nr:leucine-rich repeat domain-containing protein [Ureaplasma sp.]
MKKLSKKSKIIVIISGISIIFASIATPLIVANTKIQLVYNKKKIPILNDVENNNFDSLAEFEIKLTNDLSTSSYRRIGNQEFLPLIYDDNGLIYSSEGKNNIIAYRPNLVSNFKEIDRSRESSNIIIPNTVEKITNAYINNHIVGAFENNQTIYSITLSSDSNSVEIGYGAFKNCINLNSIITNNNIKSIGDYAFYNCPLNQFNFTNVEKIGSYSFFNTNIQNLDFNSSQIQTIDNYAFANCQFLDLENINYAGILKIKNNAFYNSGKTLLNNNELIFNLYNTNIQEIGDNAFFSNNLIISDLFLPPQLQYIGSNSFNFNKKEFSLSSINQISVDNLKNILLNISNETKIN